MQRPQVIALLDFYGVAVRANASVEACREALLEHLQGR
jgi:hypothetical protein